MKKWFFIWYVISDDEKRLKSDYNKRDGIVIWNSEEGLIDEWDSKENHNGDQNLKDFLWMVGEEDLVSVEELSPTGERVKRPDLGQKVFLKLYPKV